MATDLLSQLEHEQTLPAWSNADVEVHSARYLVHLVDSAVSRNQNDDIPRDPHNARKKGRRKGHSCLT